MEPKLPDHVRFGRATCGNLVEAERREWWVANGLGAYAAGTIAGTLTRRYHGLLIAPVDPPLGRRLVLAKADARIVDGQREYPLAANRWADGSVSPTGYAYIESFRLDGRMPVWTYACADARIEQRIWLTHGAHTVHVAFRLLPRTIAGGRPLALRLALLADARDHHATTRPGEFDPVVDGGGASIAVLNAAFTLHLAAVGGAIVPAHSWYENFDLPAERERGLPDRDAHLCVGTATLDLVPGTWVGVVGSLAPQPAPDLAAALEAARAHDADVLRHALGAVPEMAAAPPWVEQLVLATDSFVFARPLPDEPNGESVIAGYPWFGDWGRDTMIALPGLTLATGRHDTAARILRTFARFVDRGMLPNVFPGSGGVAEYNTVDAALWYIEAWRAYVEASGDLAALAGNFATLRDVVDWHVRGTRYRIGVDPADGLLRAGEPGVQLTWMDAKVGDWVVTPRIGKPVEINALWFNALVSMAELAAALGAPDAEYRRLANAAGRGFARFTLPSGDGLFDVVDGPDGDDAALRPNQILAVSLPHSPLAAGLQARVVRVVGRELLTSYGLRSLAPSHVDYHPHYRGGVRERDGGYHLGPVWAWLLGHYALAEHRVHGDATAALARLAPLADHLHDAALGSISEIFDGAPPHEPRGAPAQAWSVATALEAWWRLTRARHVTGA